MENLNILSEDNHRFSPQGSHIDDSNNGHEYEIQYLTSTKQIKQLLIKNFILFDIGTQVH